MSNSSFTDEQLELLRKPLDPSRVKHRLGGGGIQLAYLTGYDAIDTANRIFGEGSWGFEVVGVPTRDHYTD
jgi:DNA repair and recombination protein RAD52